jgi:hypothetical protein
MVDQQGQDRPKARVHGMPVAGVLFDLYLLQFLHFGADLHGDGVVMVDFIVECLGIVAECMQVFVVKLPAARRCDEVGLEYGKDVIGALGQFGDRHVVFEIAHHEYVSRLHVKFLVGENEFAFSARANAHLQVLVPVQRFRRAARNVIIDVDGARPQIVPSRETAHYPVTSILELRHCVSKYSFKKLSFHFNQLGIQHICTYDSTCLIFSLVK